MEILATMLAFPFNSPCEIYKNKNKKSTCFKIKVAIESRPKELQRYCVVRLHNLLLNMFTYTRRICVYIHLPLYLQCQIHRKVPSSKLLLKNRPRKRSINPVVQQLKARLCSSELKVGRLQGQILIERG